MLPKVHSAFTQHPDPYEQIAHLYDSCQIHTLDTQGPPFTRHTLLLAINTDHHVNYRSTGTVIRQLIRPRRLVVVPSSVIISESGKSVTRPSASLLALPDAQIEIHQIGEDLTQSQIVPELRDVEGQLLVVLINATTDEAVSLAQGMSTLYPRSVVLVTVVAIGQQTTGAIEIDGQPLQGKSMAIRLRPQSFLLHQIAKDRPISLTYTVTKAYRVLLEQLGPFTPLDLLQKAIDEHDLRDLDLEVDMPQLLSIKVTRGSLSRSLRLRSFDPTSGAAVLDGELKVGDDAHLTLTDRSFEMQRVASFNTDIRRFAQDLRALLIFTPQEPRSSLGGSYTSNNSIQSIREEYLDLPLWGVGTKTTVISQDGNLDVNNDRTVVIALLH